METAEGRCCQQIRRSVQGRLQRADPAEHGRRREKRRRDRTVVLDDLEDGMAALKCEQPVEIAKMMYARIDRLARKEPKNGRSLDAVRADVLASLVLEEPRSAGSKALIQVAVPITALLGVDERPGQLDTGQLLPAPVVRDLMSHPGTVFHRLLTDPAGQLLEYSPGIYRPKAEVDRFIRTRHRTCVMPCCSHPSRSCDVDHAVAWPEGKSTGTNLGPLDRRHHRYKHATKAKVVIADDGTTTIETRWGQTYTTKPEPVEEPPF
ncbi:HNH endonuclease signature motif containing protein [Kutzneria sp. CA-103260]|uniref:HNH endonuclease signature motif containing protein n=1 Tax=Kutzneria sp. CA-103260 TaxID=2802641 RepID=UPI001BAD4457|nr:HNH endonuclease signature motif containing protein [Kutzneria sp. CA-103260]